MQPAALHRGRAYFTLTAKKQNIAFMHTFFIVHAVVGLCTLESS
jgi:hypothetical protein